MDREGLVVRVASRIGNAHRDRVTGLGLEVQHTVVQEGLGGSSLPAIRDNGADSYDADIDSIRLGYDGGSRISGDHDLIGVVNLDPGAHVSAGIIADQWDLQFYITNLLDDDTVTSGGPNPGIPTALWRLGLVGDDAEIFNGAVAGPKLPSEAYANLPAPRIFGARFTIRFGE